MVDPLAPRSSRSHRLAAGITVVVSVLVWLLIGVGRSGYLQWRTLAFCLLVGFSISFSCRGLLALWEPWIARRRSHQALLRAAMLFLGGCLGYVVGITASSFLFNVGLGKPGALDVLLLGILGILAMIIGLGFHFYSRLEDRLRQSIERLHEAEMAEKELELARTIQKRLQPPNEIEAPGLRVAARNLPATFVAGDFYDVFRLEDGVHGIVVADVSGKGIGAALIMAAVKSRLPLLAAGRGVAETLQALNATLLEELAPREFVALSYARYDARSGELEIGNAGLPDPYLLEERLAARALVVPGPRLPLGVRRDVVHETLRVSMPPGARALFLTDGLPEAPTAAGEPLGYEALAALLPSEPTTDVSSWLDALVSAVAARTCDPRADDWTLLALERPQER